MEKGGEGVTRNILKLQEGSIISHSDQHLVPAFQPWDENHPVLILSPDDRWS